MNDTIRKRLVYGTYRLPHKYNEFSEILSYCIEQGVKWIDTAPTYNKGLSESWIGKWQEESDKNKVKISTKAGKFYDNSGILFVRNDLNSIIYSIEASLRRLQLDKIDLLFLHDYEGSRTHKKISDLINELLGTGLIEKVGLSNFPPEIVKYLVIGNRIGCLQIDAISPKIREQVFLHEESGIPVWIYRPFNQGNAIKRCGRKPEEIIRKLAEELPNCKFVFGASKLEQLVWIERL